MRHPGGNEKTWTGTPSSVPPDLAGTPGLGTAWPKPGGRRIWLWALIALALAVTAWFALPSLRGSDSAPQRKGGRRGDVEGPIPVIATAARLADVPIYIEAVGTTRPLNTVTVRPQVDGQLMELSFREGQDVKRGDTIARIDARTYQAQLDQALAKKAQDEAQLANSRRDLDRFTQLVARNAGTQQSVDTQRAAVAQLEAQIKSDVAAIENASTILSYTNVVAPIDGRTGIRNVDVGNLIRAGDVGIVTITQLKPISVLFNVPQQQLPQINRAQAGAALGVDALGADKASVIDRGALTVVDNIVDQTTGTVRLKADFPNAELQLWPGAFVNVRLLVETLKQAVVVPSTAIQRGPSGTFVYALRDDETVAVRSVTVSVQGEVDSVVTAGLTPAEKVVTTGFTRLAEGAKVRPTLAEAGPPALRGARAPEQPGQVGEGATGVARPWGGNRGPRPEGEGRRSGERRGRGETGNPSADMVQTAPAAQPPASGTP